MQHKTKAHNPAERLYKNKKCGCIEACHADEFNSTRMSAYSRHHISCVDELSPATHGFFVLFYPCEPLQTLERQLVNVDELSPATYETFLIRATLLIAIGSDCSQPAVSAQRPPSWHDR